MSRARISNLTRVLLAMALVIPLAATSADEAPARNEAGTPGTMGHPARPATGPEAGTPGTMSHPATEHPNEGNVPPGVTTGTTGTTDMSGDTAGTAPGKAAMSSTDRKFVEEAAMAGLMEVQLGQLAVNKGSSEQVRQFGQHMIDNHRKANEELKSIAQAQGITLPNRLDAQHQRQIERLQKLSGVEFDRAYMQAMVDDHEKDVSKFRKQAESGENMQVKQFASTKLPTLESHLTMARDVTRTAGLEGRGGAAGAAGPAGPESPDAD